MQLKGVLITLSSSSLVIVITGCSKGIGEASAIRFANHNPEYKVWATMRNIDDWKTDNHFGNLKLASLDVTSEESVQHAIDHIIAIEGKIDVIINNAGYGIAGTLETVTLKEAKAVFEVNFWGVVRVLQAVLPHMRRARSGYVINISSTAGIRGIPAMEYYVGSKFALEGLTDSTRYTLYPYNIAITNVNAGPVQTKFNDRYGHADVGGLGTRSVPFGHEYLTAVTEAYVESLKRRFESDEAQTADSIGEILIELVEKRFNTSIDDIVNIPLNIGTSPQSQFVLDSFRTNPQGWSSIQQKMYAGMLESAGLPNRDSNDEL